MEKAFLSKDTHLPENNIARYLTLDAGVHLVIFLKKTEWPNRLKEEIFRCARCRCYIRPKEPKIQRDDLFYHKGTCNPKGGPRPTQEAERRGPGEEKEVINDRIDGTST